jgi:allantoate deiminase
MRHSSILPAAEPGRAVSDSVSIDVDLTERYIRELAAHGAWGESGVWRTVYSPEWVAACDLFARWCEEAGLRTSRDAVGNVWGRLEGRESGASVASGSHIDTQRPGGRYDGALGAIAALVAVRALREQFGPPRRALEVVAFCEEESSRFPSANFWGSRAVTGAIAAGEEQQIIGYDGESIDSAMRSVGLAPGRIPQAARSDIVAFIELHIEQGPILEEADLPVGIVRAITGMRHYLVDLCGTQNHAGAFPMDLRRDPMAGFAEIASRAIDTAHRWGRPAVTTIGRITVEPNGAAVIPARVEFTLDVRHPDPEALQRLYAIQERMMREVADRRNLALEIRVTSDHAPCPSDPTLVALLQDAARAEGVPFMTMASGAAHDTQQMAKLARVAMIFVRSRDGRSHTQEEFSSIPDIAAGIKVLAAGLRRLAF